MIISEFFTTRKCTFSIVLNTFLYLLRAHVNALTSTNMYLLPFHVRESLMYRNTREHFNVT